MSVRIVKNVLKSLESYRDKEDGTYDFETGENVAYSTGYQVSFVRPEAFEQLSPENWDNLTNFYCTYFNSPPHIGVYLGDPEVSFHAALRDKAVEVMEEFNQESILIWSKKQTEPELNESCFIINKNFDEEKVIEYEKILEKIL